MANTRFQHKRSTVSGVVPTTSDIASGELGINLADRRLFTSNGTAVFELGSNLTSLAVGNSTVRQVVNTTGAFVNGNIGLIRNDTRLTFTPTAGGANVYLVQQSDDNFVLYTTNTSGTPRPVFSVFANTNTPNQNSAFTFRGPVDFSTAGVYANNSLGSSGQVLHSNGSGVYWADDDGGVTSVATGVGLTGGTITTTGTVSVLANNGITANSTGLFVTQGTGAVVNSTGVHVNTTFIGTLAANSASFLGNSSGTLANIASWVTGNSATAFTNATTFASNATNITTGTLANARLPSAIDVTSVNAATLSIGTNFIANSTVFRTISTLLVPGSSGEGGQIVMGYGNNLATTITGQNNNTFNIDVFGGNTGSTPLLRIFTQNGDGSTTAILNAANTGRVHIGSTAEQTDSTFKVTGTANITANAAVGGALTAANVTATVFTGALTGTASSANNASFLGGTAAASYQLNSTLAANVATMSANAATFSTISQGSGTGSTMFGLGTLVAAANQQGGRAYEVHDFNTYPNLYSSVFINAGSSTNVPAGLTGMGYRFIMGAGDTATRGFDLVGSSDPGLWFRERSNGTWNRVVTNSGTWAITANNATNLGGVAAASYQLNSTLAANVATLTANNTTFISGNNVLSVMQSLRANHNVSGGGTITVDGSGNVLWSSRFIVISNGRGTHFGTSGYFDINCPTSGTITGVGGAANKTATAAGIPLGAWEALYYILPLGSGEATVAANFRVASYTADLEIPSNWLLLCVVNGDNANYYFNNGIILRAGQSIASSTFSSTFYANATNLTTGTVPTARLATGTANSTTFLRGDQTWAVPVASINTAAQYAWTNTHTFAANVNFDSGTLFVDATNDRVGIGNTAPDARLAVTGAANISGNVAIGGTYRARNANYTFTLPNVGGAASWIFLGTFTAAQNGQHVYIKVVTGVGYNAIASQQSEIHIHFKTSNGSSVDGNGFAGDATFYVTNANDGTGYSVKVRGNAAGVSATSYDIFLFQAGAFNGEGSFYTVELGNQFTSSWTNSSTTAADPGVASSTIAVGTERYLIQSNVGINTATAGSSLTVNGDVAANFFVNPTTITASYTIPTNFNAMSAGPITVGTGAIVTVPNGSTWTIV